MHKTHIIPGLIPEKHTFKTFEDCIAYIKERDAEGEE